jgi:phage terminase large subunit
MVAISLPAKLRPLFEPAPYKVLHGGRGSGKSWGVARTLVMKARQKKLRILCAREVQKSIQESVHALISDQIQAMGFGRDFEVLEKEIRCLRTGSSFLFSGLAAHTVESIKSFEGCDICWVEEAQAVSGKSWDILEPTIRKPGSEIWITFNPQLESDETYQRYVINPPPRSVVIEMNYWDNKWFPQELEDKRLHAQKTMKPEKYRHIWEGKCMPAVEGAIYFDEVAKAEDDGRIARVMPDRLLKTHAVFDLGWNDAMTIIMVQRSASELRIVDYIEDSHKKLSDYSDMLKGEIPGNPEESLKHAHRKSYNWGQVWLPHDGFSKDYKTGKSAEEMMRALGWNVAQVPSMDVEGGIKAAREIFERVWFDKEKAARLVECLKRYRRNIGQKTGEAGTPLHDEFSHGADAFRYLAICADKLKNVDRVSKPPRQGNTPKSWMAA